MSKEELKKKIKPLKAFQCMECGKKMTVKAAEKAFSVGCTKCGSVDIDLIIV